MRICEVVNPETGMKRTLPILLLALFAMMATTYTASAQLIVVTLAGKQSGEVTRKEIAADSLLKVNTPGVEVISFQMNYFGPFMDAIEYKSNSNKITEEMSKKMKRLHRDDLLFFIHIKAINQNGDTLWADPIKFKIK